MNQIKSGPLGTPSPSPSPPASMPSRSACCRSAAGSFSVAQTSVMSWLAVTGGVAVHVRIGVYGAGGSAPAAALSPAVLLAARNSQIYVLSLGFGAAPGTLAARASRTHIS